MHDGTYISVRPYEEQLELNDVRLELNDERLELNDEQLELTKTEEGSTTGDSEDSKPADDSFHSCDDNSDDDHERLDDANRQSSEPERIEKPAAEFNVDNAAGRWDSNSNAEQVRSQSVWDIRDSCRGDSSDDFSGRIDLKHSRSHENLNFEPSVKGDEEELFEKQSKTHHKAQSNSEPSYFKEMLQHDACKVETLSYSSLNLEKFQLLKMMWEVDEKPRDQCVVRFNEETCSATIEGTSDSIDNVKLKLLESTAQFESECLKVSPATLKMLQSKNGKDWLTAEFSPLAVLYIRDNKPHLIANSETTLQSAVKRLHEIVASQTTPFQDIHEVFLQSSFWSQKVEALENSLLISIVKDESSRKIEVGGRKDDVEKGMSEISNLLTKNEPKECIIKRHHGVVRLLEKNIKAIMNSIENCAKYAKLI